MTTRRAFLESLGLALGVGVVAKAAFARPTRVIVDLTKQLPFFDGSVRGPFLTSNIMASGPPLTEQRLVEVFAGLQRRKPATRYLVHPDYMRYEEAEPDAELDRLSELFELGRANRDRQLR